MRCPNCRRKNPEGYFYCVYCGQLLRPPPGEKRFATVVFFDLSGFTRFTFGHGPERAWEEVERATQTVKRIIARHRGRVHATFGDGLLALFGLDQSRGQKEAWHAVRAAWETVREVEAAYESGALGLKGRAVVTSGFVFAAERAAKQELLGDPINRAHRMIASAPPGAVFLDETTLALAPGLVAQALPPIEAKGFPEPLKAYRLLGFQEPGSEPLSKEPLTELLLRFEEARQGRPRVAVLVGPPGVGKHLVLEAFQRARPEVRAIPTPAFRPGLSLRGWLLAHLEQNPGFREELLALRLAPEDRGVLLAAIGEGPERIPGRRLGKAVLAVLEALSARPFVLLLRNLHHAPRAMVAFLRQVERAGRGRYLVVATARRGRFPGRIVVPPLALEEGLAALAHRRPELPLFKRRELMERSGGLAGVLEALARIPGDEGLAAALQPHFDALPREARELVSLAAVLEEPFGKEPLLELLGPAAEPALDRLVAEGFLVPSDGGFRFAYPVYRRAAEALFPEKRRRGWHRALAELALRQGEPLAAARHYRLAGQTGAALRVLRALARSTAGEEAVRLLRQAKAMARTPEQERPLRLELAERLIPGDPEAALAELQGLDHPRAELLRARALAALGQKEAAAWAYARYLDARPEDADAWRGFLAVAPADALVGGDLSPPPDPALEAALGIRLAEAGQLAAASEWLAQAAKRLDGEARARLALELAGLAWRRFDPRAAAAWAEEAKAKAEAPATRVLAEAVRGSLALDVGDLAAATRRIEAALAGLADLPPGEAYARVAGIRLRYLIETGQVPKALEEARAFGEHSDHPWLSAMATVVQALAGEAEAALEAVSALMPAADTEHTRAFLELARGFALTKLGPDPKAAFLRAYRRAQKAQNPYATYLALAALAVYYREVAPRRTKALADYLLKRTWSQGFLPFHHLARLLKVEASLKEGNPVLHLLQFESPFGVLEFWRRSLVRAAGGSAPPVSRSVLFGYGILGRYAWKVWERVWIPARKSGRASA